MMCRLIKKIAEQYIEWKKITQVENKKKLQFCKNLKNLPQNLNNSQEKFSTMLEKRDRLWEELKSVSKQLTLEQFKLSANDLALENLHIKL